jgi:CheY-like chemotaxis protein
MSKTILVVDDDPTIRDVLERYLRLGSWAPYYDFIMGLMTLGKERALR